MRLLTREAEDGPRVAAVASEDGAVDIRDVIPDGDGRWTMERVLHASEETLAAIEEGLQSVASDMIRPLSDLTVLPPIARPGKIIAIGRNYGEHAAEEKAAIPVEPVVFTKFSTALIGDGAAITWRATDTRQVDYEAELAVVIGRTARDVPVDRALDYVFGYTCLDDVTARDLQFADGQWVRGKSLDTFCPIGPWITTSSEIPDPGDLRVRCRVNGELVQDANTSEMIHDVPSLIAFCSRFMTLEAGDVIATGTPGGVGVFRDPPRFLAHGDEVVVEIDKIGRLTNPCRVL